MQSFVRHFGSLGVRRLQAFLSLLFATALLPVGLMAHNLDTRATGLRYSKDFLSVMASRSTANQALLQNSDEFWVVMKTTPGPGTVTGVGGYQTFYVPPGVAVTDVAYVKPSASDPRGFIPIPMNGQSPIAVGAGSAGAKAASGLTGFSYPSANILGVNEAPVTAGGIARGTIAGVYADTGIFYSTSPTTAFNSFGAAAVGGAAALTNDSGDIVGEWDAANIAGSNVLGAMTKWDSWQLRAFGLGTGPTIDVGDGRGNAPWGMASAVAGAESGYKWAFNYETYQANGANVGAISSAIEVGPWKRIQYP
ncbi:MAG: hypothetical protein RIQ93_898, partial [Verrucomicrobiota bacterium]